MRPISLSFFASLALMMFAFIAWRVDTASAVEITNVKKVSPSELSATCGQMGGEFTTSSSGYTCEKKNCDGKGGNCSVNCTVGASKCVGVTPLKQRPTLATGSKGIQQLLTASPGKPVKSGTSASSKAQTLKTGAQQTAKKMKTTAPASDGQSKQSISGANKK